MDALLLAVTGPVTALMIVGAQRLFRAGAQDAAKVALTEQLRGEFAQFKTDLLEGINGTYRRSPECKLMMDASNQRLNFIDEKLQEMQSYAHDRGYAQDARISARGTE